MCLATRYRVGSMRSGSTACIRGVHSLVFDGQYEGTFDTNYGITLYNNWGTVGFQRKTYGTSMPRVMGGNYTVNVYGVTGF